MGSSKKVLSGYRYHMGLHMIWCAGPVDAVLELRAGDRTAWAGSVTASGRIAVDAPELFGGEEKEGGIAGDFDVMMGEPTQSANDYLTSQQSGPQPAYRGLLGLVFRRGLIAANNPYIKPWAMKVRRILKGWQSGATAWYPAKAEVTVSTGDKAANPAHVIYECLTNLEWGMGEPVGSINDASFRAAADVFHSEGMGVCMIWTRQSEIGEFIKGIVSQAGAIMSQNPSTGLFELVPIRDDYTVSSLPVLDPSNCIALESYERASPADITNELTVQYNDLATVKRGSVTVQNVANIQSQGGIVSTTRQYPGIPTSDLAVRVALRDLAAVSTPIARVKVRANRRAHKLMPGSVFRLDWPPLGITGLVLRVLAVNRGTLTSGQMVIEASEDVFSLPASGYAQQPPTGWEDPSSAPAAAPYRLVREATYYEVQRQLSTADLQVLPTDAGFIATAAARPSDDALGYAILTRSGTSGAFDRTGRADFTPHGTLQAELLPGATTATIVGGVDLDLVSTGTHAQVGSEIVRVDAINATTGAIVIGRGVLDTVAARHAAGARVFFLGELLGSDEVERIDGETIQVRMLPRTGRGELAEASAPTDSILLDQRHYRPYPPGRLRINGTAYPATVVDAPITVSWAHRHRLQQNLEGDESGSIGPEPGTTYSVRVLSQAGAEVRAATGITGTSWAAGTFGSGEYTIEAWSERDGLQSMQRQRHTLVVSYSAQAAWNRRWGIKWGLPAPLPKVVEITLGGYVDVGAVVTVTLGGTAFSVTEAGGDTLASIAAALAGLIHAHADYTASASGAAITVTGPDRIDYSASVTIASASASIGAPLVARAPAAGVQAEQFLPLTGTPAAGQVLTLTINGAPYSHTVTAGQSLAAAAGALATAADAAPGVSVVADTTRDQWRIAFPVGASIPVSASLQLTVSRDLALRRVLYWHDPAAGTTRAAWDDAEALDSTASGAVVMASTAQAPSGSMIAHIDIGTALNPAVRRFATSSGDLVQMPELTGYTILAIGHDPDGGALVIARQGPASFFEIRLSGSGTVLSTAAATMTGFAPTDARSLVRHAGRWLAISGTTLYTRDAASPVWSASSSWGRYPADFPASSGWSSGVDGLAITPDGSSVVGVWWLALTVGSSVAHYRAAVRSTDAITWAEVLSPLHMNTGNGAFPSALENVASLGGYTKVSRGASGVQHHVEVFTGTTGGMFALTSNAAGTAWSLDRCTIDGQPADLSVDALVTNAAGAVVARRYPTPSYATATPTIIKSPNGIAFTSVASSSIVPPGFSASIAFDILRPVASNGNEVLIERRTTTGWSRIITASGATIPALMASAKAAADASDLSGLGCRVALDGEAILVRGPAGSEMDVTTGVSGASAQPTTTNTAPTPVSVTVLADAPATAFTAVGAATGLTTIGSAVVQNPR